MTNLSEQIKTTAVAAKSYKQWLTTNSAIAGSRAEMLRQDCVRLEDELARLSNAASRRMCVGVFGQSQAGKSYLVSSLASRAGENLKIKAGNSELSFIGDVNPIESNKESTGIVTRFTVDGTIPDPEFPIEIKLLSEMDVAKILSDTYFQDLKEESRDKLKQESIQEALATVPADILAKQSDRAFELKRYLHTHIGKTNFEAFFGHYELFWSSISTVLEFGALEDRIRVYSLFWGNDSYLTETFTKMVMVLEELNHPVSCWAPTSIFNAEANCIIVSTQEAIWDGTGVTAELTTHDGVRAHVDHSIISALTAEMVAVITDAPSSFYNHADLLDFPGARTRAGLDAITTGTLGKSLTRGKVAFLFNRYLDARELTAMLLCVKESTQEVGTLPKMVEDWLKVTHGNQASERSADDCALFFVLTMADKHFGATNAKMLLEDRMASSFEKFIGSGDNAKSETEGNVSWLNEWTPGKAFNNTFWLRNASMETKGVLSKGVEKTASFEEISFDPNHDAKFQALLDAAKTSEKVKPYFKDAGKAWQEMVRINDGGRSYLLGSVERVCHPEFKLRQLQREHQTFQDELFALTGEFFADGDAERVFKERVARAEKVILDIRVCAKARKFGELLATCHIKESTVSQILRQIERQVDTDLDVAVSNISADEADPFDDILGLSADAEMSDISTVSKVIESHLYFANKVLDEWRDQLVKVRENKRLREYFHLSEASFSVINEELLEGARRVHLAEMIAETSRDASRFPRFAEKLIPHKSRLAAQTLNSFVNQLGYEAGDLQMPNAKQTKIFSRPKVPADSTPKLPRDPEKRELLAAAHWAFAFKTMTSQNAETDNGLDGVDLEANATLGKIIESLSGADIGL